MTIRSVHRPFEDRERQELGSPDERLQDSSDPDTGSEEEGSSRLSPPHSPRGEVLAETWLGNGVQPGHRPLGCSFQMDPASESPGMFRMVPDQPLRSSHSWDGPSVLPVLPPGKQVVDLSEAEHRGLCSSRSMIPNLFKQK